MFGNNKCYQKQIRQKYVYSEDYKHRYLVTEMVLFGRIVSKSTVEIFENKSSNNFDF